MPDVSLGPFLLTEPLARGGMGEVWSARHPDMNLRVAVKVLTGKSAREDRAVQSFRNEMRSLAGLDHHTVVHLFDHGLIDERACKATGGRLIEGSPYMVMEFASGGSLSDRTSVFTWPELQGTLFSVLDALAHAHSRGVVHRDLKPGNLLICTEEDTRPGMKLTDFGIAHAVDWHVKSGAFEHVAGTLHYMSPEQVMGNWRDYGPWTDLYALGCMAYRITTGTLPFSGNKGRTLLFAQLREQPPPIKAPLTPIPDGFEEWILKLMAKNPIDRFTRAADAAWALANLGDPGNREPAKSKVVAKVDQDEDDEDVDDEPTFVPADAKTRLNRRPDAGLVASASKSDDPWNSSETTIIGETTRLHLPVGAPTFGGDVPPLPRGWSRTEEALKSMRVVGAGQRLYGLRATPLIGRKKERDAVWKALRAVHRTESPRLVYIHGEAGTGKSRLVEWICERAHEVGGADVLMAVHGERGAPGDGIRRMVTRYLQTMRLGRAAVERRVREHLERSEPVREDDVFALSELLSPLEDDEAEREADEIPRRSESDTSTTMRLVRLQSARERHQVVGRLLEQAAENRPVIVVLEDVHWGPDTINLADWLVRSKAPILTIMTGRDDEFAVREDAAYTLELVLAHRRASEVEMHTLPASDHQSLVEELLFLEKSLAARVAERTDGNPLFAVELVGDWVNRGILKVTEQGFVLRAGLKPRLPGSLHEVWAERIQRAIAELPADAFSFLGLAATLGQEVDDEEWQELCDDPEGQAAKFGSARGQRVLFSPKNARLRVKLLDALLGAHLAIETDEGWSFTHGMIRESLELRAREDGEWKSANAACANMLARRGDNGQPNVAERIGLHLVESEQLEAAIDPLMTGVTERAQTSGYRPALALLGTCEDAMRSLFLEQSDDRWGRLWLMRAQLAAGRGELAESTVWTEKTLEQGVDHGWELVLRDARYQRAQAALRQGELTLAQTHFKAMRQGLDRKSDPIWFGKSVFGLAAVLRHQGATDQAYELFGEAARHFQKARETKLAADCWRELAALELASSSAGSARGLYRKALNVYETLGDRAQIATCLNGFAECARLDGDLEEAELGYKRALALYESIEGGQAIFPKVNLGLVYLHQDRFQEASRVVHEVLKVAGERGRKRLVLACHVLLLAVAGGQKEWAAWDKHIRFAVTLLDELSIADPDNAWATEYAGELAERQRKLNRAMDAYSLAFMQYEKLEMPAKTAAIEKKLGELQGKL